MQLLSRPRALLLDVGNTVAFLDEVVVAEELSARADVRITPDAIRHAQGPAKRRYEELLTSGGTHDDGWFVFMEALLAAAGIEAPETRNLARLLRVAHDELNLWRRVPDGLAEGLADAKRAGLRLGVVSNSEGKVADLLAHVGLGDAFEVVVDSGVEGVAKPDPEIFDLALSRMGVSAADAIYVGDVPSVDIDGARAAGLGAILIDAFGHYPDYEGAPKIRAVTELFHTWF